MIGHAKSCDREELGVALSNRAAAYLSSGQLVNALVDAEAVIKLRRNWTKAHWRKGKVLQAMGRLHEARLAIQLGLDFEPEEKVGVVLPSVGESALSNADIAVGDDEQDLAAALSEIDRQIALARLEAEEAAEDDQAKESTPSKAIEGSSTESTESKKDA